MKKLILSGFMIFVVLISNAQKIIDERNDSIRRAELNDFIGKIVGTNTETPKTSFVFDITKSPELKLNIPLNNGVFNQFYIDGKIGSSNDYTPLVKKGEWLPDLGINFNFTKFITTTTKFNTSDINNLFEGDVENGTINEASQLFWSWVNFKAGYNYATLETYNGDLTLLNKDKFSEQNLNSLILKSDVNFFYYPSKSKTKWLSFNGKLGFEFKTNDNNYSSLKSVNIREIELITDANGNIIEVSSDEKKIKQGKIITKNTSNINYNLMALISPTKDFYVGLSTYGKQTLTKELKSTDIGFGITIPITKKKETDKTIASFTLKYEIPDINNELSTLTLKEKGTLGFSIGLPINIFGKN
ncbi:hypothetical protein QWY81_06355 [Polaribacter undariae]|uniref:Uncharacterized protein n=1 Tax=Polaribacter sejongensis TaxID=985043 RepID=A0AAJ1VFQ2_9FLAO|nr:hypothetical protein [Polaribacter undariae]MDN3619078.1 hypothetical protein [Polaribacter undariae]UWD33164.1 hypothetical protein NQP51_05645 [Polaribacter undariae]